MPCLPSASACLPTVAIMEQGHGLEEVGVGYLCDNALVLPPVAQRFDKTMLPPPFAPLAVPNLAKLMTLRGVHRGDELEGVERLAAGVNLLENGADRLLAGRGRQ